MFFFTFFTISFNVKSPYRKIHCQMNNNHKIFKVKAGEFIFTFTAEEIAAMDIIKKSPTEFSLIRNHKSVNAKLTSANVTGKRVLVEVEGASFDIEIKDELDQMLELMGFGIAAAKQVKNIKAPMPGLVL